MSRRVVRSLKSSRCFLSLSERRGTNSQMPFLESSFFFFSIAFILMPVLHSRLRYRALVLCCFIHRTHHSFFSFCGFPISLENPTFLVLLRHQKKKKENSKKREKGCLPRAPSWRTHRRGSTTPQRRASTPLAPACGRSNAT